MEPPTNDESSTTAPVTSGASAKLGTTPGIAALDGEDEEPLPEVPLAEPAPDEEDLVPSVQPVLASPAVWEPAPERPAP